MCMVCNCNIKLVRLLTNAENIKRARIMVVTLDDYKKGFLKVTRCPAMIAYDLDRDAVQEVPVSGRPARRAPKRELFVAESATVDNKKLKGAES